MSIDSRSRALLLLTLALVVGVIIGVAGDRRLPASPRGLDRRRPAAASESASVDRIPQPLEDLGLSDSETARLRGIARHWRPQTLVALGDFRQRVNDLENQMFAEMLCALPADKRDRYVAQLRAQRYDPRIIAKRLELVNANRCH
jgi:hypothetical protein